MIEIRTNQFPHSDLIKLIDCAMGRTFADIAILQAQIVDVFTRKIFVGDIAVIGGRIASVGTVLEESIGEETILVEANEKYLVPGFIESHIHIESTLLCPTEFTRVILPRGTTTCVCDPHEITNVLGKRGAQLFLKESKELPIRFLMMVPSCVPAAPSLETGGKILNLDEIDELLSEEFFGLAEMMNFPGVYQGNSEVIGKLNAALKRSMIMDGHAPGLSGKELNAYLASGIMSDHESSSSEEVLIKLQKGMRVMIREGSFAKNLRDLVGAINSEKIDTRNCMIVSDDRHSNDILEKGHLDHSLRIAVEEGLDPIEAIQWVTINPATYLGLERDIGGIAPGMIADLIVLEEDLAEFNVSKVVFGGKFFAKHGKLRNTVQLKRFEYPSWAMRTINLPEDVSSDSLKIYSQHDVDVEVNTIKVIPHSLVTEKEINTLRIEEGVVLPDPHKDILPIAVLDRHNGTGNIGKGFVRGLGIQKGAVGSTVAHDSHQLIVSGVSYKQMALAANELRKTQGGLVVVTNDEIKSLPLPYGGIMSTESAEEVSRKLNLLQMAVNSMGDSIIEDLFMCLSFLSLPVIPALKITDLGLVDVEKFQHIELFVK